MNRRAALYGVTGHGAEWQKCYSALLSCLEDRFGDKRVWKRSTKYYDPIDVADDVAVAVIHGLRGRGPDFLARCLELNIPTVVVDLGWLRRERGYWQVSLGGLNRPPPRAPSSDRFDRLDLKVFPPVVRDFKTVIVGQLPGDAQHDLDSEQALINWARGVAEQVKSREPKRTVFWRPHPAFITSLGRIAPMTNPQRTIQDLIREDDVGSAVVYNSTFGIELLRNGVHVIAQGPRTVYTDVVSSDIANLHSAHPGPEQVRFLLEKLAYGQYQLSELQNWSTLERLFALHGITGDW